MQVDFCNSFFSISMLRMERLNGRLTTEYLWRALDTTETTHPSFPNLPRRAAHIILEERASVRSFCRSGVALSYMAGCQFTVTLRSPA